MSTGAVRTIEPARAGITPWRAFKADPTEWFDPEEIAKAKRYVKPLRRVGRIQRALTVLVDVVIIGTHAMPNMLDRLGFNNWVLDVFAVIAVTTVASLAIGVGFDWWQSMVYDKKWDFSTMTAKTFFADLAKGLTLGLVLNALLTMVIWTLIRGTELWWLWAWVAVSVIQVGFAIVYPRVIAPMFNKFTQLDDEALHAEILRVAHGVGADIEKVEIEDASKRDTRKNAYVGGAGKTRRMVLFDTMLEWPKEQIVWVCAHEIGHWRRKHILRFIPFVLALLFIDFAVLRLLLTSEWILDFAGVESLRDPGAIPLFYFVFALPGLVTGLASAYMSRVHERDADLFGLEAVPDPDSAMTAMRKLYTESLSDLTPSLWKRLNHSHPPVAERLAMISEWGSRQQVVN